MPERLTAPGEFFELPDSVPEAVPAMGPAEGTGGNLADNGPGGESLDA